MMLTKIRTKFGKILTLKIERSTKTHIFGTDKFGEEVTLPKSEIDMQIPYEN